MEFSVASISDLDEVFAVYQAAIRHLDEQGIFQWDERYPSRAVIQEDIARGEMELGRIDGRIAVAFSLSEQCDEEYHQCAWRYPDARFCVLHRLCVHPEAQGRGVGSEAMAYIERELVQRGYVSVRLDAFSPNANSLRLYEKCGYERVGEVRFRKGLFYFYEKKLDDGKIGPASQEARL